jgi:hypothetical protein
MRTANRPTSRAVPVAPEMEQVILAAFVIILILSRYILFSLTISRTCDILGTELTINNKD